MRYQKQACWYSTGSFDEIIEGGDGYRFFWSGKPSGIKRESGVGFAIKRYIVSKLTDFAITLVID